MVFLGKKQYGIPVYEDMCSPGNLIRFWGLVLCGNTLVWENCFYPQSIPNLHNLPFILLPRLTTRRGTPTLIFRDLMC